MLEEIFLQKGMHTMTDRDEENEIDLENLIRRVREDPLKDLVEGIFIFKR
jgi:hypothetical protein